MPRCTRNKPKQASTYLGVAKDLKIVNLRRYIFTRASPYYLKAAQVYH